MTLTKNPRAIVTGGGSGLGRGFCIELGKRGAKVIIADINLENAEETARLVRGENPAVSVFAVHCDVSKLGEVMQLEKTADELIGGVDLIVNNAGVAVSGPVGDIPISDWIWILGVNLWGVIHGCHVFVPRFKKQGGGHVINVASSAGLVSAAALGPYNVTKAGVVALSETLAGELAETPVGVTVLCPTFFKTNIVTSGRAHSGADEAVVIANKLMDAAKLDANGVARAALDGAEAGDLYVVPMADGRWMWRVKRFAPQFFYKSVGPWVMRTMRKRLTESS